MRIRSKVDGEHVYGWYCKVGARHFIVPNTAKNRYDYESSYEDHEIYGIHPIDLSQTAVATGKKDRNGVKIFGSKGLFRDGDRVKAVDLGKPISVNWNENRLWWGCPMANRLSDWESEELEIIPKEETPQQNKE